MVEAQLALLGVLTLAVLALFIRVRALEAKIRGVAPAKPPASKLAPSAVAVAAAVAPAFVPAAASPAPTSGIPLAEVEDFIRAGKMIDAIKLWRTATGVGLKDAKDAVDAVAAEIRRRG